MNPDSILGRRPLTRQLPVARVRKLRLRSQLLAGATGADAHEAVKHMGALQAQSTPASRLSLRPRTSGLDAGDAPGLATRSARSSAPGRCEGRFT